MALNISGTAQQPYGKTGYGIGTPALHGQPLKPTAQKAEGGLVARLNNINGELTPCHKGGDVGNRFDYLA